MAVAVEMKKNRGRGRKEETEKRNREKTKSKSSNFFAVGNRKHRYFTGNLQSERSLKNMSLLFHLGVISLSIQRLNSLNKCNFLSFVLNLA